MSATATSALPLTRKKQIWTYISEIDIERKRIATRRSTALEYISSPAETTIALFEVDGKDGGHREALAAGGAKTKQ